MSQDARDDAEQTYQRSRSRERLSYVERESKVDRDVAGVQELLRDRSVPVSLVDRAILHDLRRRRLRMQHTRKDVARPRPAPRNPILPSRRLAGKSGQHVAAP